MPKTTPPSRPGLYRVRLPHLHWEDFTARELHEHAESFQAGFFCEPDGKAYLLDLTRAQVQELLDDADYQLRYTEKGILPSGDRRAFRDGEARLKAALAIGPMEAS